MPLKIAGLPDRAKDYIIKNSVFTKGAYIGCKKSDGVITQKSSLYKTEVVNEQPVMLFKHYLNNNLECYEEIQVVKNNILFVKLITNNGEDIKWRGNEIKKYSKNLEV